VYREALLLFIIFVVSILMRLYFGFYRPTGDLEFYTSLEYTQLTLFGFQKEFLFYPLYVFDSIEMRIMALAVVLALTNILALVRLLRRSGQHVTILVLLIAVSNWYFAQIDMHLERQQLSIYLFILCVTQSRLSLWTFVLCAFSVLYHEIALLLFGGWLIAWILTKLHLNFVQRLLRFGAIAVIPLLYLQSSFTGVIFLFYTMLGFLIVKKETSCVPLGDAISIMIMMVLVLNMIGFLSFVNFTRTIGVLVSVSLFRLMFDGQFQLRDWRLKVPALLGTLLLYGVA